MRQVNPAARVWLLMVSGAVAGVCQLLLLIFLIFKLADIGLVASWSWWWVLSPAWLAPVVIFAMAFLASFVVAVRDFWRR